MHPDLEDWLAMRAALTPQQHANINRENFPGTRQLCSVCEGPTDRCEEDEITVPSIDGPLCVDCYQKTPEYAAENTAPIEDVR